MNRSRYVIRQIDTIDRAIIAALTDNGRMTVRELAAQIGLSIPSITDRILKLQDAGAIMGYTICVDPKVFGLSISAHVRMRAMPGQVPKLTQMLVETPAGSRGGSCYRRRLFYGQTGSQRPSRA